MRRQRVYSGLFNVYEQRIIKFVVPKLPVFVTPDRLSGLSICAAVTAALALIFSWWHEVFLGLFVAAMVVHWFGDSFDGALARYRNIERVNAGLLVDRSADIFSYFVIIGGLAFSPYLSPVPALLLLVGVLVNALYSTLINLTDNEQVVGVGGLGGTEGRIIVISWVLGCAALGIRIQETAPTQFGPLVSICALLLLVALYHYAKHMVRRIAFHREKEVGGKKILGRDITASAATHLVSSLPVAAANEASNPRNLSHVQRRSRDVSQAGTQPKRYVRF